MFKKIFLMVILTMAVVGCSAHDMALWKEARQERIEEGRKCFRRASGTAYCVDKYGNRVY
ncbi:MULTISPECIES: hypothetical protein [unclassified Leptotrichia]|uniref:hypothetical protein n=1 Tax=unclassified Leptotrichia TaxID=2633022 RepID=UPI0003AE79F1|nr:MULTISPECIES: hypothetical protein [unclassified Leptotrichia]ERL26075.1 hypothetical protein HMPREF9108_01375 [Leptotrichia sp. oral taxon 225 str. F0581]WLD74607.1 hypothetical protein QU666_01725 [Leptotrichia sp. HMT-225]